MPKPAAIQKPERVILLIAGESGSGKSFAVANLKNALIFDTDIGGGLAYLDARIKRNGSERVEVGSYVDVIDELTKRRAQLKDITTLGIDHVTTLQQESVLRWNPAFQENTFGREHDRANKEWRKLRDLVRWGDFNLVCTAHLKAKYEQKQQVGVVTDGAKNLEADFNAVLHLVRGTGYPSQARVMKWRRDPEDERGKVPSVFPFTLEKFEEINGAPIGGERRAEVKLADPEQVKEAVRLCSVVKLPEGTVEKWFSKAKVDEWREMPADVIQKCIDHLQGQVKPVSAATED